VSYSVTREKAPIFTMGSADPRSYSRNKRGIAGSLIWINFDRHALLDLFAKAQGRFLANIDDIRPQFRADSQNLLDQTAIFNSALVRSTNSLTVADTIDNLDNISLTEVSGFKQLASPWYSDQILPFDITFQVPRPGPFILPASFSSLVTDLKAVSASIFRQRLESRIGSSRATETASLGDERDLRSCLLVVSVTSVFGGDLKVLIFYIGAGSMQRVTGR
jgi:hypothetical protein